MTDAGMSFAWPLRLLSSAPPSILIIVLPSLAVVAILTITRIYTTLIYWHALKKHRPASNKGSIILTPPQIPYSIPWLGHALSFTASGPGRFWTELFTWHPRSTGAMTLLLAGRKTHILYSPFALQALFKARSPTRDGSDHAIYAKVFQMSDEQIQRTFDAKPGEHSLNAQFMTNFARVNDLTADFTRVLGDVLSKDVEAVVEKDHVGIYEWLRDCMFNASVTALMGEKLLQMYPKYCQDFFHFDGEFIEYFFDKPAFLMRQARARRDRMFSTLEIWAEEMRRQSGGEPVDPDNGPSWEPYFGSRLNRARQRHYKSSGLTTRTAASQDAGIVLGLASNVIPATGWMILYLLRPESSHLLPRVLAEIEQCIDTDGLLNIPKLVNQQLLQCVWVETLRLCSDILVTRTLVEDIYLPLDGDGDRKILLRKGEDCFAPAWITQRDPLWKVVGDNPFPPDQFNPERFLITDAKTGEQTFSMSGTAGMYFPFGGGKTICPGRIFAKQEAMGALAMFLLRFEFEFKGFVDLKGKPSSSFPGFKNVFPGSGTLVPGGDMLVNIKTRQRPTS